jgi:hypothetical protein
MREGRVTIGTHSEEEIRKNEKEFNKIKTPETFTLRIKIQNREDMYQTCSFKRMNLKPIQNKYDEIEEKYNASLNTLMCIYTEIQNTIKELEGAYPEEMQTIKEAYEEENQ